MSAKHALLGLLLHKPAYTYELGDRLQARLGPTWAINSGHLYQTAKRLERDGLIERVGGDMEARHNRRIFAITASGVEEFERWFEEIASAIRLSRRPLLVKITLAGPERLRDALEQIDAYEFECATCLKEFSHMHEDLTSEGPRIRADHVLLRLALSADIFQLEAELRWARHAHEMVSWLLNREAVWLSEPELSGASTTEAQDRRDAREELFARMAARRLKSPAGPPEQGRDA
jgi:DNA-binding PadR family transcriptional regulator